MSTSQRVCLPNISFQLLTIPENRHGQNDVCSKGFGRSDHMSPWDIQCHPEVVMLRDCNVSRRIVRKPSMGFFSTPTLPFRCARDFFYQNSLTRLFVTKGLNIAKGLVIYLWHVAKWLNIFAVEVSKWLLVRCWEYINAQICVVTWKQFYSMKSIIINHWQNP